MDRRLKRVFVIVLDSMGTCCRAADAHQIGGDEGYPPLRNGSVSAWCIEPNQRSADGRSGG